MGSTKAWAQRIDVGLCKYCGKNPPDSSGKKGHRPGAPPSNVCAPCKKKRFETYRNRPYNSAECHRDYRVLVKRTVFEKYGNKCAICSEHRWECLTIDHVNQDGKQDRLANPRSGAQWFMQLKREPRRQDLRVLCMSCNWSIAQWGYSPLEPNRPPQNTLAEALEEFQRKWVRFPRKSM
jgi:hypothetical protein